MPKLWMRLLVRRAPVLLLMLSPTTTAAAEALTPAGEPFSQFLRGMDATVQRAVEKDEPPGAAVALVLDGQVVAVRAYGRRNVVTSSPVTRDTVFDAASNGKVILAAIALQLVGERRLDLDRPLSSYLRTPYLDNSLMSRSITARQVLDHSTGLPNRVWERVTRPDFTPGQKFSCSGNAYNYLQRVIETIEGGNYESIAQRRIFRPLGMSSTSYEHSGKMRERLAPGHVRLGVPLEIYLQILLKYAVLPVLLASVAWSRLFRGHWVPSAPEVFVASVIGLSASLWPFLHMFSWPALLVWGPLGLALLLLAMLIFSLISLTRRQLRLERGGSAADFALLLASWIGAALLLISSAGRLLVPVPLAGTGEVMASTSLLSAPRDLAKMLAEFMAPTVLPRTEVAQALRPQIPITPGRAWGLGLGLEERNGVTTIWHSGVNPGATSLQVGVPKFGSGIVIMTNGPGGEELAWGLGRRFTGIEAKWSLH